MSAIDQYLNDHPETRRRMRQRQAMPSLDDAAPGSVSIEEAIPDHLVLDETRDWFARYVRTQRDEDLDAITLWAAHTHLLQHVPVSPRMIIDSLMPGAGKTTLLEHFSHLCHMTVIASGISSPALIPRMIAAQGEQSISVLIDEADRTLDPKKEGVGDLIAVINSGSKRGATRPVLVPDKENGWKAQNMPTYSAVAMAGNSPTLPDDTRSRSIQVFLLPDTSDSIEETDWVSDETMDTASQRIHDMLAAWAESHGNDIQAVRPVLPDGCKGRMKERWITFAKIAAIAGGRWPDAVKALVLDDIERVEAEKADGLNTLPPKALLVQDCLDVMQQDFTPTAALVGRLAMSQPERWGSESPYGSPLTRQRLAKMLSPMGVHSKQGTTRENRTRGYLRADIEKVSHSLTTQTRGAHRSHGAHGSPPVHHVNDVNDVHHVPQGAEASCNEPEELDF